MIDNNITSFNTFINALRKAGFTMAGDNSEGIFTLADYYSDAIEAHTDQPETDPWAWRMRSLKEYDDIFYSKLFFNKGGYITGEWYPYFYVIRRQHQTFEELYEAGQLSYESKQVYGIIKNQPHIALHEIKSALLSDESSKSKIELAITLLQMKMFITISGEKYKLSREGKPYGWPVTTFALVDDYVKPDIINASDAISVNEAARKITSKIVELNPKATDKKIKSFLGL